MGPYLDPKQDLNRSKSPDQDPAKNLDPTGSRLCILNGALSADLKHDLNRSKSPEDPAKNLDPTGSGFTTLRSRIICTQDRLGVEF
jgi:hypothetical protein